MKVTVLTENTAIRDGLACVHGLSLLIETRERVTLLDFGPGCQFYKNAARLGKDLRAVDAAFLSHGHNDHGGGLEIFLRHNPDAPVYVSPRAFEPHWVSRDGEKRAIGLDPALPERFPHRFVPLERSGEIAPGLAVITGVSGKKLLPGTNGSLMREGPEGLIRDDFAHEQSLVVTEDGLSVLFAGCAHTGIVNILDAAEAMLGRAPDYVVSGFHLHSQGGNFDEPEAMVAAIGEELRARPCRYITGHCTGKAPFTVLKAMLGGRLSRMSTGSVFILPEKQIASL